MKNIYSRNIVVQSNVGEKRLEHANQGIIPTVYVIYYSIYYNKCKTINF